MVEFTCVAILPWAFDCWELFITVSFFFFFLMTLTFYLFIYFWTSVLLFLFFLLYSIVLVLPYINMNQPRVYTCSQSWTPPPISLPVPSLWVIPVHQPQASCILHQTWTGDSFLIWYYTCFNANSPKSSPPTPSPRVQKTVLYICVSFAVLHTGLSLPSF